MPAQLDRLASLATLATVDLAILPTKRERALEWHSFDLLELADGSASYVTTELVHAEHLISDPELVAPYATLWDRLWEASVVGSQAMDLINQLR